MLRYPRSPACFALSLAAAFSLSIALDSSAIASPELRVEGRHFKDAAGRVVVLRGVNVAGDAKVPPFRPAADPAIFDPLAQWGLNAVRLLFTWEAYEPAQGQYDESYLDYYVAAARAAWERGLYVIVDFHQDGFSRSSLGGCGDGFPAWAIPPSIEPAAPDNGASCADWGVRMLKDTDMAASWDSFYADETGARTRYLAMLKSVAARLDPEPGVVGYDIINEPWGDEVKQIGPFYKDAAAAIREASPSAILFLEPRALVSAGNATELEDPLISNSAYAPHFYDATVLLLKSWSGVLPDDPFNQMFGTAEAWGVPLLLGEFGAPAGTNRADEYISALFDRLNEGFASGTQWVYTPGWTPDRKDGWNTEDLSIVDDHGEQRDNFRPRPYARKIGGTPKTCHISNEEPRRANQIDIEWENDGSGETEIFVPIKSYFDADDIVIKPSGEGLTCSITNTKNSIVTCVSSATGPMAVHITAPSAATSPQPPTSCGLTGIEMLFLLPLYAASRRSRRRDAPAVAPRA